MASILPFDHYHYKENISSVNNYWYVPVCVQAYIALPKKNNTYDQSNDLLVVFAWNVVKKTQ